jgi:hypothetical protein
MGAPSRPRIWFRKAAVGRTHQRLICTASQPHVPPKSFRASTNTFARTNSNRRKKGPPGSYAKLGHTTSTESGGHTSKAKCLQFFPHVYIRTRLFLAANGVSPQMLVSKNNALPTAWHFFAHINSLHCEPFEHPPRPLLRSRFRRKHRKLIGVHQPVRASVHLVNRVSITISCSVHFGLALRELSQTNEVSDSHFNLSICCFHVKEQTHVQDAITS